MKLEQSTTQFVSLKRSLGAIYTSEEKRLKSFRRFVGSDAELDEITSEHCQGFCYGRGPTTKTAVEKHQLLKRFFRFAVGRGHLLVSPAEGPTRRVVSTFQPYIYSRAELGSLLDASSKISRHCQFDGSTLRTLLLLLYATGLRVGEALRLRCCDVDLKRRIVNVWDSKFFKSRLVPFDSTLARSLLAYRKYRQDIPFPLDERSSFFPRRTGEGISQQRLQKRFRRVCEQVGIHRDDDSLHEPRIHDLRATFAVHRLIAWYREGRDIQKLLPFLATYLGHTSLSGTQTYLRMTPELLAEASRLFESYAVLSKGGRDE